MNAQTHIRKYQQDRAEHAALMAEYTDLLARTTHVKQEWRWCANLDRIEEDLQAMEQRIARFEWRTGIS